MQIFPLPCQALKLVASDGIIPPLYTGLFQKFKSNIQALQGLAHDHIVSLVAHIGVSTKPMPLNLEVGECLEAEMKKLLSLSAMAAKEPCSSKAEEGSSMSEALVAGKPLQAVASQLRQHYSPHHYRTVDHQLHITSRAGKLLIALRMEVSAMLCVYMRIFLQD